MGTTAPLQRLGAQGVGSIPFIAIRFLLFLYYKELDLPLVLHLKATPLYHREASEDETRKREPLQPPCIDLEHLRHSRPHLKASQCSCVPQCCLLCRIVISRPPLFCEALSQSSVRSTVTLGLGAAVRSIMASLVLPSALGILPSPFVVPDSSLGVTAPSCRLYKVGCVNVELYEKVHSSAVVCVPRVREGPRVRGLWFLPLRGCLEFVSS